MYIFRQIVLLLILATVVCQVDLCIEKCEVNYEKCMYIVLYAYNDLFNSIPYFGSCQKEYHRCVSDRVC